MADNVIIQRACVKLPYFYFRSVQSKRSRWSLVNLRHMVPHFVAIGQTIVEIWGFFDFSNMAAVRHLGFVMRMFRPPTKDI